MDAHALQVSMGRNACAGPELPDLAEAAFCFRRRNACKRCAACAVLLWHGPIGPGRCSPGRREGGFFDQGLEEAGIGRCGVCNGGKAMFKPSLPEGSIFDDCCAAVVARVRARSSRAGMKSKPCAGLAGKGRPAAVRRAWAKNEELAFAKEQLFLPDAHNAAAAEDRAEEKGVMQMGRKRAVKRPEQVNVNSRAAGADKGGILSDHACSMS